MEVRRQGGDVLAVYGRPMTEAATPDEAAERWLAEHAGVFNVEGLDLRLVREMDLRFGKATVYTYAQYMGGVRVENARARIIVRNGKPSEVIYVSARLAHPPAAGFRTDRIAATEAATNVRGLPEYADLPEWSDPELVVFYKSGNMRLASPVRAWMFQGHRRDAEAIRAFTFFVDCASGSLVHARNDVAHIDITGSVNGNRLGESDLGPDDGDPGVVLMDLRDVCMRLPADCPGEECDLDDCVFTDANGECTIPHPGGSPVTVEAAFQGRWATVVSDDGIAPPNGPQILETLLLEDVTPPGPADFTFNPTPTTEFRTAAVNAFAAITSLHDFFAALQPGFTELDCSLQAIVNYAGLLDFDPDCASAYQNFGPGQGTCDEGYLVFHHEAGGCYNMAFSTVLAHEYGHFVVAAMPNGPESTNDAFVEGYADALALLRYDTSIIAEGRAGPGTYVRNYNVVNRTYPCNYGNWQDDHFCGMVLGGVWDDINHNLQETFTPFYGLLAARNVFAGWTPIADEPALITGPPNDSADPLTAIQVLMADDIEYGNADGDVTDAPHLDDICRAFWRHNIPCFDCNRNGDWDACDIDCGEQGGPCDYFGCGGSEDVDANGIPDECDEIVVYYVDQRVSGGAGDCSSWPDACDDLQEALDEAAQQWQHAQIWVAEGTYKPSRQTDRNDPRSATFQLLNDTELYGGFLGNAHPQGGETDLSERDFENNVTTLSGDIGVAGTSSDNAYHVVTGSGTDITAVLDGFTITAGNANGSANTFGGGMFNSRGSPTIRNCVFETNRAQDRGGGMFNRDTSAPTLYNCRFTDNHSLCTSGSDCGGGGMWNEQGAHPTLTDCLFNSNIAGRHGGGMVNKGGSGGNEVHVVLNNCDFRENETGASGLGGGIYMITAYDTGASRMTNCSFVGNIAFQGGGVYNERGKAWLTNCKFLGNQVSTGSSASGGAVWSRARSDHLRLFGCLFSGNTATGNGGAVWLDRHPDSDIALPIITNCTFSLNTANATGRQGGGIFNNAGDPAITNCIFWGNTDGYSGGPGDSDQIFVQTGTPVVTYSIVEGLDHFASGEGNLDQDPVFQNPTGGDEAGDENDDLHQKEGSPAIDAGSNAAVPLDFTVGLDGSGRIFNTVDMGVYEFYNECADIYNCGDVDQNGISDDNCMWYDCVVPFCTVIPRTFADAGGAFGACEPDGWCNIHDANLALACFTSTTTCESLNIDIGGSYGACPPDGFCNVHDANHALTCFAGTNTCTCPLGPSPDFEPPPVDDATIALVVDAPNVGANGTVRVRAFLEEGVADFQSYQLHLGVSGGTAGQLDLIDIAIEPRDDYVFAGFEDQFEAFNVVKRQMLSGLKFHSVATQVGEYLATFTYRVSADAAGDFVIDVLHDAMNDDQTFLIASYTDRIEVNPVTPGVVHATDNAP